MKICWVFHNWSKWEEYKQRFLVTPGVFAPKEIRGITFEDFESWQKRTCQRCGKVQRESVKES